MVRYVTISVPEDVKKILEKAKGREDWGSFLLRMYREYEKLKRMMAFRELKKILTDDDLRSIESSMKEFRRNFKLR